MMSVVRLQNVPTGGMRKRLPDASVRLHYGVWVRVNEAAGNRTVLLASPGPQTEQPN